ncbi:MAG TPA: acetate--CoA ligase family protein [Candidatus Pacearchaeota archaeon]|nr:acetate--CoA ligase family protein [Candidatus Pacearchaeota archaeon]
MEILSFKEAKDILLKYKMPFCETEIFDSLSKGLSYAEEIGFPVALKAYGKNVFHRTEQGGVAINIKTREEFRREWNNIYDNFKDIEGVLIQKMIKGKELILGMNRNEQFGPVLMFGLGGIYTELYKDVALRVAPVSKKEALEMIKETKAYEIVKGFRGEGVNEEKLIDLILKLSNLSIKEEAIQSIDFNPVMGNKEEVLIVDFKIVV